MKFTKEGEISISVSSTEKDDGEYEIHFAIRDTGIGIPADKMDRLLQTFSQIDASTTRKYGAWSGPRYKQEAGGTDGGTNLG